MEQMRAIWGKGALRGRGDRYTESFEDFLISQSDRLAIVDLVTF